MHDVISIAFMITHFCAIYYDKSCMVLLLLIPYYVGITLLSVGMLSWSSDYKFVEIDLLSVSNKFFKKKKYYLLGLVTWV